MANNNQDIEDINNNNDDEDSPVQQRSFLQTAFITILTPLINNARAERQLLIGENLPPPQDQNLPPPQDQIRILEQDIGSITSLFGSVEKEEKGRKEEEKKNEKREEKDIMSTVKYTLGGVSINSIVNQNKVPITKLAL